MEWAAFIPDLTEHLWDQLGWAVGSKVTNTTILADLQQILYWSKNQMSSNCSVRPGGEGGARLLWLGMVHAHASEVPVC